MSRIAVREERVLENIALRGARGQTGGGPHSFHVEDDGGNLRVVSEADELAHERDSGTGSGGHGSRTGPCRAERHPDGGDLVLRLYDRVVGLAGLRIVAEAAH